MSTYLRTDLLERIPFDGSASFTSNFVDLQQYATCWVWIEYSGDASTDPLQIKFKVDELSQDSVGFSGVAASGAYAPALSGKGSIAGGANAPPTVTAGAFIPDVAGGGFWMYLVQPPPLMQLVYTRTTGTRKFFLTVLGRSA